MKAQMQDDKFSFFLSKQEAIVLAEALTRMIDDDESALIKLLYSSAEFAVLCRINNHLQGSLPEMTQERYDDTLKKARQAIIKESGRYAGIEEHDAA